MDHTLLNRLRDDLRSAAYTASWLDQLLPADMLAQLRQGVTAPAREYLRRIQPQHSRHTLARLFLTGEQLTREVVEPVLAATTVAGAEQLGLVSVTESPAGGECVTAALSLTPFTGPGDEVTWWFLSDLDDHLRAGPAEADHVMGVGEATRSLLSALPTTPIGHALDVGTGCGVIALWLTAYADEVTATDLSPRACMFARANATLNEVNITVRTGDLFAPVTGERFDLVASNPPFVIEPVHETQPGYVYRSSGKPGDALVQELLARVGDHLTPSGRFVCLLNWEHHWGSERDTELHRLLPEEGVSYSVSCLERGSQTPLEYAALWLRDSGVLPHSPGFASAITEWIEDFSHRHVIDIRFGYLTLLREPDVAQQFFRHERHTAPLGEMRRFGDAWQEQLSLLGRITAYDQAALMQQHFLLAPGAEEHRQLIPGTDQVTQITLTQRAGITRYWSVDTVTAALLGACDGSLSADTIVQALAELLEASYESLLPEAEAALREGVAQGFLTL